MDRTRAYQLICAAEIRENLSTIVDTTLPSTESQARPLRTLPPEEQREVWAAAVEQSGGPVEATPGRPRDALDNGLYR